MSYYKELLSTRGRFAEAGKKPEETRPERLQNVGAVVLRMGSFKYDYVAPAYASVLPAERILRLETQQEEPRTYPGKPEYIAAFKAAEGTVDMQDYAADQGITLTGREQTLAIGQDVQLCNVEGDPIYKPTETATKDTIFETMQELLCTEDGANFRVKSGSAVWGKNENGENKGVMLASEMRFTVSAFTSEELELYVYGIEGRNGDNPDYLRAEVGRLADEGLIDDDETDFIEGGTSLGRLGQTNGGFRWPHPIFLRHITSIDKVTPDQDDYAAKQQSLVQSLVGASPESLARFPEMVSRLEKHTDAPTWQKLAILPSGELVQIRPIRLEDDTEVETIAALVARNFRDHPNYAGLTDEARDAYIESNNVEGVRGTASHPDNILAAVMEGDDGIIAYSVVRKVNGNVAEGRRLHVRLDRVGQGIGSLMHEEKVVAARLNGCTHLGSIASGKSDTFVGDKGYDLVGSSENKKLRERGVTSKVNYALKEIASPPTE